MTVLEGYRVRCPVHGTACFKIGFMHDDKTVIFLVNNPRSVGLHPDCAAFSREIIRRVKALSVGEDGRRTVISMKLCPHCHGAELQPNEFERRKHEEECRLRLAKERF
jgi:hypothetical protein